MRSLPFTSASVVLISLRLLTCHYLQCIKTDSKSFRDQVARHTFGGDVIARIAVTRRLRPFDWDENWTVLENPARNDAHATQAAVKKQRRNCCVWRRTFLKKWKEGPI